jgi:integrase/recombinase XerC
MSDQAPEHIAPAAVVEVGGDLPAAALLRAFLSGKSPRTVRAYRRDVEDFRAFTRASAAEEAAQSLLSQGHGAANALALTYRADLLERGLQAATVNRRLAALRSLVTLAGTLGIVPWRLEVANVRSEPYRDTRGPGRDGVRRLFEIVESRTDPKSLRDRAVLHLLYDLALRRGEVVSLDVEDVDLDAGTVAVLGKGYTQRAILTLSDPAREALSDWLRVRGTEPGPLFTNFDPARKGSGRLTGTSVYRMVRHLGAEVGVTVRPHGLRHTSITEACKLAQANGLPLEEVLDFSRHKDVQTLMIYRDRAANRQGHLASLVASGVDQRDGVDDGGPSDVDDRS